MAIDIFEDENVAQGLPAGGTFQAGVSDYDPAGQVAEQRVLLPWASDDDATWVYYDCALECFLDSGIVVHRRLPQYDGDADTLATCFIDDKNIDKLTGRGVNLKSVDQFEDVVQRMAHSRYWFHLHGQALRVGQRVPIPGLKTVGGVEAVPADGNWQHAANKIAGNYSGVPLWRAYWSLWYTLASPPDADKAPVPPNLAAHIGPDVTLPTGMQAPYSQPDDDAQSTNPIPQLQNPLG